MKEQVLPQIRVSEACIENCDLPYEYCVGADADVDGVVDVDQPTSESDCNAATGTWTDGPDFG